MDNELEILNQEIKKLKRELRVKKLEFNTELENIQRKQDLLNLLSPRTDMEDLVQVLFAYIIRIVPFERAFIRITKENYSFSLMVSVKDGEIEKEKNYGLETSVVTLIKNVLINAEGFLVSNLKQYDPILFSDDKTAMIFPIFIGENSNAVCYIENDVLGSYSDKEFELLDEILQITALTILKAIDSTLLSRYQNKILLNPITALYTGYYMKKVLEKQIIISRVTQVPFTLILAKIRNDKSQNIDDLIIHTANLFKKLTRKVDTVFQVSRNTLAILLNNSDDEVAKIVIDRLENGCKWDSKLSIGDNKAHYGDYSFNGKGNVVNTEIIKLLEKQILDQIEEKK